MAEWSEVKACFWCCNCCIFWVLFGILIGSFVYVDYNEYAFAKNSVENKVYTDEIYDNGRYLLGPNWDALTFPSLYQFMKFSGDKALSVANNEGVSITVDVEFMYRLRKHDLVKLYKKYGTSFHTKARAIAQTRLKNTAVVYSTQDWLKRREDIAYALNSNMTEAFDEIWIDVPPHKLAILRVKFSARIEDKFLAAAIQLQENEQREYEQESQLIRDETNKKVENTTKDTTIITRTAEAEKQRMIDIAKTDADRMVSSARGLGIANTLANLTAVDGNTSMINATTRALFIKLMAILDNESAKLVDTDDSDSCVIFNANNS